MRALFKTIKGWSLYVHITSLFEEVSWGALTPSKLPVIALSAAGTPLLDSVYEPHTKTSLILQVTYVFVKQVFHFLVLEGWSPLIFINLMSNLKVRNRATKHY